jgi:cold shock CspA family protein
MTRLKEGHDEDLNKVQDNNQRIRNSIQNKFESQFNGMTSSIKDLKHGINMLAVGKPQQESLCYHCGVMGHYTNGCPIRGSDLFIKSVGSKNDYSGKDDRDRDTDRDRERDRLRGKDGDKNHGFNKRKNTVSDETLVTGEGRKWIFDKRYGFISPKHSDEDIYVHKRNITDGGFLKTGDTVTFAISSDKMGRKEALKATGGHRNGGSASSVGNTGNSRSASTSSNRRATKSGGDRHRR